MRRKRRKEKRQGVIGSRTQGYLWLNWATSALPLSHNSQTTTNPHNPLYYCTSGTECLSCTPGSHSACAVRTPWLVVAQSSWLCGRALVAQDSGVLHGFNSCMVTASLFTFLRFRLLTSKFIYLSVHWWWCKISYEILGWLAHAQKSIPGYVSSSHMAWVQG